MPLADELQSGVPVVSSPALGAELQVGQGFVFMAALFVAPSIIALVVEPVALALSDYLDRRRFLIANLLGMALCAALAAAATSLWGLALFIGLWGTFVGIAHGVAQGALVAGSADPDRELTRWTLAAAVGDLLAPVALGAAVALGFGWRAALAATALLPLFTALRLWRAPIDGEDEDEEELAPLGEALRGAISNTRLLSWLVAVASCALLDEIVLVYVAVRVGAGVAGSAQILALLVGSVVGLALLERLRLPWRGLLLAATAGSALSLVGFVLSQSAWICGLWLFVLGATCALHYPLAKARTYAELPGRPGLVNALDRVLGGADLLVPLAVGAVASRWGADAALLVLLLQPLCVGLVALRDAGDPQ